MAKWANRQGSEITKHPTTGLIVPGMEHILRTILRKLPMLLPNFIVSCISRWKVYHHKLLMRKFKKSLRQLTVYPTKYAHGSCFAVLCGYTLTDFPISIRLTSLALWQSNDCPSASKATLMNMDKYFMWIHYGRLHNHNKAKHNKTVCIFLGVYCTWNPPNLVILVVATSITDKQPAC